MPNVTSLSQYALQNLGPLTTTFTAPASCATLQPAVALARTQYPWQAFWSEECDEVDDSLADCRPSGRAFFDIYADDAGSRPVQAIPYFSPGLACPESWTTAGVAVKDADGSVVSTSGIYAPVTPPSPSPTPKATDGPSSGSDEYFKSKLASFDGTSYVAPPQETEGPSPPKFNPVPNIMLEALGAGETVVACCPS